MKFMAALINHSLQPARTIAREASSADASVSVMPTTSPESGLESINETIQDSTLSTAISLDAGIPDSGQSEVIETEMPASSDLRQKSPKTDFNRDAIQSQAIDNEELQTGEIKTGLENSVVFSSSNPETHPESLPETVNGMDVGDQTSNQYFSENEEVRKSDTRSSFESTEENVVQSTHDHVFSNIPEGFHENLQTDVFSVENSHGDAPKTGLDQKIETTDSKGDMQDKSVSPVNEASPVAKPDPSVTANNQEYANTDINRQAPESAVERPLTKQIDPAYSMELRAHQVQQQSGILPSEIKSVKRPERREPPQVKIGHINVLIDDQAVGKPKRATAKSASRPSNPFGMRGL